MFSSSSPILTLSLALFGSGFFLLADSIEYLDNINQSRTILPGAKRLLPRPISAPRSAFAPTALRMWTFIAPLCFRPPLHGQRLNVWLNPALRMCGAKCPFLFSPECRRSGPMTGSFWMLAIFTLFGSVMSMAFRARSSIYRATRRFLPPVNRRLLRRLSRNSGGRAVLPCNRRTIDAPTLAFTRSQARLLLTESLSCCTSVIQLPARRKPPIVFARLLNSLAGALFRMRSGSLFPLALPR